MKPEYEVDLHRLVDVVHCPSCGERAKYVGLVEGHDGYVGVTPQYCCDTEGCPFSLEGPKLWTLALSD